jgi:hypothetical protein
VNDETENVVLEHQRGMCGELSRISNRLDTLQAEMSAARHHISGMAALQDHDHADIAEIESRLDRIELRLDLVDDAS